MASLDLHCLRCGARVPAEESQHGQLIPCPNCAAPLLVPGGAAEAVEVGTTGDSRPSMSLDVPHRPRDREASQPAEAPRTPEPPTVASIGGGAPRPQPSPEDAESSPEDAESLFAVDDYEVEGE